MYGIGAYCTFARVWAFIWKLGSGSQIQIRIRVISRIRIRSRILINVIRIHNTGWCFTFAKSVSLGRTFNVFTVPVLSNRNRVRIFFRPTFNFPPRFDGLPETLREESPLVDRPSGLLLAGGLPRLRRAALSAPPPTRWTILRGPSPSPLISLGLSYFFFPNRSWILGRFVALPRFCHPDKEIYYCTRIQRVPYIFAAVILQKSSRVHVTSINFWPTLQNIESKSRRNDDNLCQRRSECVWSHAHHTSCCAFRH